MLNKLLILNLFFITFLSLLIADSAEALPCTSNCPANCSKSCVDGVLRCDYSCSSLGSGWSSSCGSGYTESRYIDCNGGGNCSNSGTCYKCRTCTPGSCCPVGTSSCTDDCGTTISCGWENRYDNGDCSGNAGSCTREKRTGIWKCGNVNCADRCEPCGPPPPPPPSSTPTPTPTPTCPVFQSFTGVNCVVNVAAKSMTISWNRPSLPSGYSISRNALAGWIGNNPNDYTNNYPNPGPWQYYHCVNHVVPKENVSYTIPDPNAFYMARSFPTPSTWPGRCDYPIDQIEPWRPAGGPNTYTFAAWYRVKNDSTGVECPNGPPTILVSCQYSAPLATSTPTAPPATSTPTAPPATGSPTPTLQITNSPTATRPAASPTVTPRPPTSTKAPPTSTPTKTPTPRPSNTPTPSHICG